MIREWCDQCGERFEPEFVDSYGEMRPPRCPHRCDNGVSDLPEWPTCDVAELFWTAIAHERARVAVAAEPLTLNPDDAIAEVKRMAKLNRFPFDHIVASGETLVALARHVAGPEEAERLRLEIEALEHDATPSDIMAEHDATPSEKGKV